MSEISEWPCWKIRQCSGRCNCPAGTESAKACWEVIGSKDYCLADICSDCLVYVIKQGNSILTENDLRLISHARGVSASCTVVSA